MSAVFINPCLWRTGRVPPEHHSHLITSYLLPCFPGGSTGPSGLGLPWTPYSLSCKIFHNYHCTHWFNDVFFNREQKIAKSKTALFFLFPQYIYTLSMARWLTKLAINWQIMEAEMLYRFTCWTALSLFFFFFYSLFHSSPREAGSKRKTTETWSVPQITTGWLVKAESPSSFSTMTSLSHKVMLVSTINCDKV